MVKDTVTGSGVARLDKYRLRPGQTEEELIKEIEAGEAVPYETREKHNLWLNTGWTELLKLITGESANHFNAVNSRIGVGDSATAAAASQTDLQATTNKTYKGMESTYPTTPSSQTIQFRAKFTTSEANYAWAEVVLKNVNSGVCWNRVCDTYGTKTNQEVWYMTLTIGKA